MKSLIPFLLFSVVVFSQKATEIFKSNKLGEDREITIGLPASYDSKSDKKYPLMILLDGDYLFDPFYGAFSYGAYWDDLPETIIVGVTQNKKQERIQDCMVDDATGLPFDKGANFFEFIGAELVPYIEKKYKIAPFRMIAGHDLTAGFMNFFLYKEVPLFNAYISLSPELSNDMETRITDRLSSIKEPLFYYQSTSDGDVKDMVESIKALDENIKAIVKPNLNYKYDEFKNASHYSLVLYSIPNALCQFFSCYKPISMSEYSEKIEPLTEGYVKYLTDKYDAINKTLGLKTLIRVNDFRAIEAAILKNKAYPELEKLAALAKKNYPKSMLADYELGLMYEKTDDLKKALKAYQSASLGEEIGVLTKEFIINKIYDIKGLIPKK